MEDIITRGIDRVMAYAVIDDGIQQNLSIDPGDPILSGWRAQHIISIESMRTIDEGLGQQYNGTGFTRINVDVALTAHGI